MIRINLLPPEIIERRKYERFYPYVFVVTAVLVAIVAIVWLSLQILISSLTADLQSTQENSAALRRDAEKLAVFELKEQELAVRQEAAGTALNGRIDMGSLAEEVSLVLPEEVWLSALNIAEVDGFRAQVYAPDPLGTASTDGYKSAASTLVRLSSLGLLQDVWLNSASVEQFQEYQGVENEEASADVLLFEVSAKIRGAVGAPEAQ